MELSALRGSSSPITSDDAATDDLIESRQDTLLLVAEFSLPALSLSSIFSLQRRERSDGHHVHAPHIFTPVTGIETVITHWSSLPLFFPASACPCPEVSRLFYYYYITLFSSSFLPLFSLFFSSFSLFSSSSFSEKVFVPFSLCRHVVTLTE